MYSVLILLSYITSFAFVGSACMVPTARLATFVQLVEDYRK